MYGGNGIRYMASDQLNESYFINFAKIHSFHYTNYDDWARCMADVGCVEIKTTVSEHSALIDFYNSFDGSRWRIRDNWLDGDPCVNQWYGVQCNVKGEVIALHFFENHLVGTFASSIGDLIHLKHLSIFNGDLEYEGEIN